MEHKPYSGILVLTSTFPRWIGDYQPPFVYELSRRVGSGVHVLCPHTKGAETSEQIDNIAVHRFRYAPSSMETLAYDGGMLQQLRNQPLRYLLLPLFFIGQLISIVSLCNRYDFKVIHAHWIIPQGLSAILARVFIKNKPKIICTAHGGDLFSLRGRMATALKRWTLKRIDYLTVVGSSMVEKAIELGTSGKKLSVIPMGADLKNKFVPDASKQIPRTLVFAGRLVEKKGLTYLIEAMREISKQCTGVHLTIVGSGPEYDDLRSKARALSLDKHISFTGAVPNEELPRIYQQNQIAVFPFIVAKSGDQEGLPVVVSEALGSGCCVVTTDIPSIEDIVKNEYSGLIVNQRSSSQLTNAIIDLLNSPDKVSLLALNGRNHVLKYMDWQQVAEKYRELITRLAKP